MAISVFLLVLVIGFGLLLLNGWVLQRAARILGVEVGVWYATLVAVLGGVAQFVAQLVVAVLVLGTASSLETMTRGDWLMTQGASFILGTAAWTALISVMLDVDLLKAFGIGLLFSFLQIVLLLFVMVTLGNLVLITLLTLGAGS
jgi:hypothetical protein